MRYRIDCQENQLLRMYLVQMFLFVFLVSNVLLLNDVLWKTQRFSCQKPFVLPFILLVMDKASVLVT